MWLVIVSHSLFSNPSCRRKRFSFASLEVNTLKKSTPILYLPPSQSNQPPPPTPPSIAKPSDIASRKWNKMAVSLCFLKQRKWANDVYHFPYLSAEYLTRIGNRDSQ